MRFRPRLIRRIQVPQHARGVTLKASNRLEVKLASQPGSFIIINIEGRLIDTTPPAVRINTPADNSKTTAASLQLVAGTATDTGAGASGVRSVIVNGVAAAFDAATGNWNAANVPLSLGANRIVARATDAAGNQSSAEITVTREQERDTAPPALSINAPADGLITQAAAVEVSGTVSDAGTPVSGVAEVTERGRAPLRHPPQAPSHCRPRRTPA